MNEQQYLIVLLKAAIEGRSAEYNENIDMKKIFVIAKAHNVANIICYAFDKSEKKPENYADFQKCRDMALVKDVKQEHEILKIFTEFNKNNIKYMPLKGYIMKNLYPVRDMRMMADVDILIKDTCDFNKIKKIMECMGYNLKTEKNGELDYLKPPVMNVEISDNLLGEVQKKWEFYFENYWEKAIPQKKFEYKQKDEDYFIYHIVHLSKHYSVSGTGIRSFLDIHIYLKAKPELDWEYIKTELEKLNLNEFCENCIRLSKYWFDDGERDGRLEDMERYVIESGVYGIKENHLAARSVHDGKVDNVLLAYVKKYFFGVFPSYRTMTNFYSKLRKYPFLLPYYWICRWIRKLIHHDEIRKFVESGKDIDSGKAKKHNDHMKSVGL